MENQPKTPSQVPDVIFKTRVHDDAAKDELNPYKWQDLTTKEIFAGKTVVLFGLPGAFTPTCSSTHLPGYENNYRAIKAEGVDDVYCLSVNDAFVMNAWAEKLEVENVKMLPDGNTDFTHEMGMLVKKENLGFGLRSWRYSMIVVDGNIEKLFIEPGFSDNHQDDPFEVSDAFTMLKYLRERKK